MYDLTDDKDDAFYFIVLILSAFWPIGIPIFICLLCMIGICELYDNHRDKFNHIFKYTPRKIATNLARKLKGENDAI